MSLFPKVPHYLWTFILFR